MARASQTNPVAPAIRTPSVAKIPSSNQSPPSSIDVAPLYTVFDDMQRDPTDSRSAKVAEVGVESADMLGVATTGLDASAIANVIDAVVVVDGSTHKGAYVAGNNAPDGVVPSPDTSATSAGAARQDNPMRGAHLLPESL
ncbi:hypothetical protein GUJ93_ZPchr0005g15903 [Zizania palustris]|uniref:Uncharacterized protein n=1 Tax=Zizania palustris TaxID=103762 RepID=A0A8J5SHV6_ZIZPA|nr:hypothetical protein GUJ93_ZPchr0005g15903 [Zizania palustris]